MCPAFIDLAIHGESPDPVLSVPVPAGIHLPLYFFFLSISLAFTFRRAHQKHLARVLLLVKADDSFCSCVSALFGAVCSSALFPKEPKYINNV